MISLLKPCCSWQKVSPLLGHFNLRSSLLLRSQTFTTQQANQNLDNNEEEVSVDDETQIPLGSDRFRPAFGASNKDEVPESEIDESGEPFRPVMFQEPKKDFFRKRLIPIDKTKLEIRPPRWNRMPIDQDWPSVWPTAASFRPSAVPLPVRMGYVKKWKLYAPPGKHANLELMKIPNFLHLTPKAIQRHCKAIKKFCTPWPEALKTDADVDKHFPVSLTSSDYVHAGPSIRDPRSRIVTLQIKVGDLQLDHQARDKFLRLVGDRYDEKTDVLTLETDRCPARQQNKDYGVYLLTVLNREARKVEGWEGERVEADIETYVWEGSQSQKTLCTTIRGIRAAMDSHTPHTTTNAESDSDHISPEDTRRQEYPPVPEFIRNLSPECSDEEILSCEEVKSHVEVWKKYRNEGETWDSIKGSFVNYVRFRNIIYPSFRRKRR